MTKEEILKEIEKKEKEIEELKKLLQSLEDKIEIEWTAEEYKLGQRVYLAILSNDGGKEKYKFLPLIHTGWDGKYKTYIWKGSLPKGTILRGRHLSKYKKSFDAYYIVSDEGLEEISKSEALKKLGII